MLEDPACTVEAGQQPGEPARVFDILVDASADVSPVNIHHVLAVLVLIPTIMCVFYISQLV